MYKYIITLSELTVSGSCLVAACSILSQTLTHFCSLLPLLPIYMYRNVHVGYISTVSH